MQLPIDQFDLVFLEASRFSQLVGSKNLVFVEDALARTWAWVYFSSDAATFTDKFGWHAIIFQHIQEDPRIRN